MILVRIDVRDVACTIRIMGCMSWNIEVSGAWRFRLQFGRRRRR
jgi:hypothetical protein